MLLAPLRLREEIEKRLERAYDRMERIKALAAAVAARDQAAALVAWGADGALDDYEPAQVHREFVGEALTVANALRHLETKLAANDGDDQGVRDFARQAARWLGSDYASRPLASLKGASIRTSVELIDLRGAFLDRLERAGDDLAGKLEVARSWDNRFGRDHPRLKPLLRRLNDCLAMAQLLDTLNGALRRGDDAAVARLWSNEKLAEVDAGTIQRVRAALQRFLDTGHPFVAPPLGEVTKLGGRRLRLAWDWDADRMSGVTHAQVILGERVEPSAGDGNSQLVKPQPHPGRASGKMAMGRIEIELGGRRLIVSVRPAIMAGDTPVVGRQGHTIKEPRRVIQYSVRPNLGGIGGNLVEIRCDRPAPLPALKLVAEKDPQEVIKAIETTLTDQDGRLSLNIDSTTGLLKRMMGQSRRTVLLVLADEQGDRDWVEIVHPDAASRTYVA